MSLDSDEYIKNTEGLRKILGEQLVLLREGKTTPQNSNAVCNITSKMIQTVRLDMDVHKFKNKIIPYSFDPKQIEENKEENDKKD